MNKEKRNEKIAKITGIIIGLVLVLGISYAVFKTTTLSDKTNEISAGKLDLRIENEQEEILLENAIPETEEEGLKRNPYVFDIVNFGTINAAYDLYIEVNEEVSTLSTSVIRYYLTVEEDNEEKIVTSTSRILSSEATKEKEGVVDNYKKGLLQIGCSKEDVSSLQTMDDLVNYISSLEESNPNIWDELDNAMNIVIAKEVSSITDMNSLMAYLLEERMMDEEENLIGDDGNTFSEQLEIKYNTDFSTDPIASKKIELEDGITNIPEGLFTGNEEINEVRIPASVTTIDQGAFENCRGLTTIALPKSVTSIGSSTFSNCTALTSIEIPNSAEYLGSWVFNH